MTGILAKQLFLHPWAPERAVNVQVRVHGLWLCEAVQPTSSALRLLEGEGTSMKDVHAWGPASWTVVNSQPILPPASDLKVNTLHKTFTHDGGLLGKPNKLLDLTWTSITGRKGNILFIMNKRNNCHHLNKHVFHPSAYKHWTPDVFMFTCYWAYQ